MPAEDSAAGGRGAVEQGDLTAELPVPGLQGISGPWPWQYHQPHVYARDIHSIPAACICGAPLADPRHPWAAPGVPVPARLRRAGPERGGK